MVDASDEMMGSRIGTVNASLEECIPLYYKEIEKGAGLTCYFRVMKYGTEASWVNSEWQSLYDWIFNDIQASGSCEYGSALNLLGNELAVTRDDVRWIVVNIACGCPTDNWKPIMDKLNKQKQFRNALRIVLNIEDKFPPEIALDFAGNVENVMCAKNAYSLKKLILKELHNN